MTTIQTQIQAKIESFARELDGLIRQAAVAAVGEALATRSAPKAPAPARAGRKPGPKAKASKPVPIKAAPKAAKKAGKRKGRSPLAIQPAAEQILKHIKANPGQRSELVRAAVGTPKNVWILAMAKLVEEKKIVKKGQKRATTLTAK